MGRFVSHESCPRCGSRDNLGRYDDGSAFCFGCKYWEPPTHAPRRLAEDDNNLKKDVLTLPDDTNTAFSQEAVAWLSQYHLSVEEAIKAGVRWSESKQQLIFLLEDGCWQARNFYEAAAKKRKYFTAGNVNDSIKIYLAHSSNREGPRCWEEESGNTLAVVEDCVSAIRISGAGTNAMPVLGSHVSRQKLTRLARLYSRLIIWLDHDKLNEARGLSTSARMLGLDTKVIYTDLDPKCYTNEQLKEYLQ